MPSPDFPCPDVHSSFWKVDVHTPVPPPRQHPGRLMPVVGTFRIGAAPRLDDGLRIGAVRRPPRGVRKEDWTPEGYFDVWLPTLAPSQSLLSRLKVWDLARPATWRR